MVKIVARAKLTQWLGAHIHLFSTKISLGSFESSFLVGGALAFRTFEMRCGACICKTTPMGRDRDCSI